MTRIIPRRKKHIIPLIVIGIILSVILVPYTEYFWYVLIDPYVCSGCERGTANSNAKLVYTNFATYMTKCEVKNVIINDGIYFGSLAYSSPEETYYRNYYEYALLDGSEEDIVKFLRCLMGGTEKSGNYGYFCVIVKGGEPIQSFWCRDEKLLYYKDNFAAIVEIIPDKERYDGAAFYTGGAITGGYPTYNIDHKTKPPLGHTSHLPIQIILRDTAEEFVTYFAYALIIFSPLIILLLVSLFVHRYYTPSENKYNAQSVFEAAEVYVSEYKNTLPDMKYSGVLKARRDEPEICFDGSAEDFSAFLSNIAVDKSKNYYTVKIENGKVSESRFSVSRRLLKGVRCKGVYIRKEEKSNAYQ